MRQLFAAHGLDLSAEAEQKFQIFGRMLREENAKFNLTSITEEGETAVKHFLDSAVGAPLFPAGARVAEIGSGGGFPSVPLMIVRPDLRFTLVEATRKKCEFLRAACARLDLPAEVVCARAEDLAKDARYREKFDAVTARAVARLPALAEYCLPFARVGGVFVAYKGDAAEEIAEAARAFAVLGGRVRSAERYALEGAGTRTLVAVEKSRPTPAAYPRGRGKERSKPL